MRSTSWFRAAVAALLLPSATALWAASAVWAPVAEAVIGRLEQAVARQTESDREGATRGLLEAYFGVFESEKFEAAMRVELGARRAFLVEKRFGELRKQIKAGASGDELRKGVTELAAMLREDAAKLDAAGVPREVFAVNQ